MSACAVLLENAVLRYPISPFVRGSLKEDVLRLLGRRRDRIALPEEVTALNGVSLRIDEGERVGLIGHNGAGKSSLLKAMARVYPLAGGRITVRGRVQALFELGLGFESEETGRQNILYRGLALGHSPETIAAATDEIIAFAELGAFIDYPLRTYSAGMIVRLAFAISTSLHGDILLLDEIFGAGDATFQQKARARMAERIRAAGIVVMVSHDLHLIAGQCTRVLWVQKGQIMKDGPAAEVVDAYHRQITGAPQAA